MIDCMHGLSWPSSAVRPTAVAWPSSGPTEGDGVQCPNPRPHGRAAQRASALLSSRASLGDNGEVHAPTRELSKARNGRAARQCMPFNTHRRPPKSQRRQLGESSSLRSPFNLFRDDIRGRVGEIEHRSNCQLNRMDEARQQKSFTLRNSAWSMTLRQWAATRSRWFAGRWRRSLGPYSSRGPPRRREELSFFLRLALDFLLIASGFGVRIPALARTLSFTHSVTPGLTDCA